ncbi:unnamed protein product [Rhizophagus irregularis]|nr:unnamed protein product [Rhizophagus irregularis]
MTDNNVKYPHGFEVLKSYFLQASKRNVVPSLSEFINLNGDYVARLTPKSNNPLALDGAWTKRFSSAANILNIKETRKVVEDKPNWTYVIKTRYKAEISESRHERTYEIKESTAAEEAENAHKRLLSESMGYENEGDPSTPSNKIRVINAESPPHRQYDDSSDDDIIASSTLTNIFLCNTKRVPSFKGENSEAQSQDSPAITSSAYASLAG